MYVEGERISCYDVRETFRQVHNQQTNRALSRRGHTAFTAVLANFYATAAAHTHTNRDKPPGKYFAEIRGGDPKARSLPVTFGKWPRYCLPHTHTRLFIIVAQRHNFLAFDKWNPFLLPSTTTFAAIIHSYIFAWRKNTSIWTEDSVLFLLFYFCLFLLTKIAVE